MWTVARVTRAAPKLDGMVWVGCGVMAVAGLSGWAAGGVGELAGCDRGRGMLLKVGTYNLRNITDRYDEREKLLHEAVVELDCDILGLQEVTFGKGGQTETLPKALEAAGRPTTAWECPAPYPRPRNDPSFRIDGNAALTGASIHVLQHDVLKLGKVRAAQRLFLQVDRPDGGVMFLWFVNTHFHHLRDAAGDVERNEQAEAIVNWMIPMLAADERVIVVGDFNAAPGEPAYKTFLSAGMNSAYAVTHGGAEPKSTFPTGLRAPTMDTDPPLTTDYIFVAGQIRPVSSRMGGLQVHASDPTVCPSDHYAIVSEVELY